MFPAVHPEIGDIEIIDDGDELTVNVGNFTHCHFSNYDSQLTEKEAAERIAEDTVLFLQELFSDQIVLWGSHRGSGGCYKRDQKPTFGAGKKKYIWSGLLSESES